MDQAARLRALVTGTQTTHPSDPRSGAWHGSSDRQARVIAVSSGKGGVGKTTLAVNLAILLAEQGETVLLVDADLGLANVDVMLGLDSSRHIGHLMLAGYSPEDVAQSGPAGIRVISGGSGLRELATATSAEREGLIAKLRSYYSGFDFVVVDTSPGIGDQVVDFLKEADELLLVTTGEPTSLRDVYAAAKSTNSEMPGLSVRVVVNMATSASEAEEAVGVLNHVAGKFLNRSYSAWHSVSCDSLVGTCIRNQRPLVLSYPRSAAATELRRLAKTLVRERSQAAGSSGCWEVVHAVG